MMPIDSSFKDAGVHLDWQYLVSYALSRSGDPECYLFTFYQGASTVRNALFLFMARIWSSI